MENLTLDDILAQRNSLAARCLDLEMEILNRDREIAKLKDAMAQSEDEPA